MTEEKMKFNKWRLLGLLSIAIWLFNLILNLFIIPARFGFGNEASAWQYNLWSCPFLGLVIGIGLLLDNKFLVGAGALWGIFPVFLSDILMITSAARELAAAQGFLIPFLKLTPEFEMLFEMLVGKTGVNLIIIEEFATHWIGNFLLGIIGLLVVGISKWSFIGTTASFLFTAWFTQTICPFYPPNPPGAPSLFIQAIPMTVIWLILNVSIHGLINKEEKKKKIFYAVLTTYWIIALLIFNSLPEDQYQPLLLLGYLVLYIAGRLILDQQSIIGKIKTLYAQRVKWLQYTSLAYLVAFSAFFFLAMRPTILSEGEGNPIIAYILFGCVPFLLLSFIALILVPRIKNKA